MLDLDSILLNIEKKDQEIMTTKELIEHGLNKYYIKKALDNGRLIKVDRGIYQVSRGKKRNESFQKFRRLVLKKEFKKAYETLCINMENQITHEYDNDLRIYFILLAKILGYDDKLEEIKYSEQLFEFSDAQVSSYYSYFVSFREHILNGNFQQALSEINRFKDNQLKKIGHINISTNLFYVLTNEVVKNIIILQKEKMNNYKEGFQKFKQCVFENDFEKAYEALLVSVNNRVTHDEDNYLRLYLLLLDAILGDQSKSEEINKIIQTLKVSDLSSDLPYYSYFEAFQEKVLNGDFENDFVDIANFRKEERKDIGYNNLSTNLFYVLSKVAYNTYNKKKSHQYKQVEASFNKFIVAVSENDFKKAYEALLVNIEYRVTHDRDNELKLCYLLLDSIVGYPPKTEKEQKIVQSLGSGSLFNDSPFYSYFEAFQEKVLNGDFKQAFPEIAEFKKKELENNKINKTTINLLYVLTKIACKKQKQREMVCNNFFCLYRREDYGRVIKFLNNMLPSISDDSDKVCFINLINLVTTFLDVSKNKVVLEEMNLDYGDLENVSLVYKALENKDYVKAYLNIEKCVCENPGNNYLKLYQTLLYKIMDNNKGGVKNKRFRKPSVLSLETKNRVKNFTLEQIRDLVYNREYDQLREFLMQGDFSIDIEKVCTFVSKMLYDMDNVAETKKCYEGQTICYKNSRDKEIFKRFFEALRYKDYQEAYQCVLY